MIQNVATENAHFVIDDQELSTEESPKEKQFRMDCFRYALRAIESDQLIFRVGTVKFEGISGGSGNQRHVRAGIYQHRKVGLSFTRWSVAQLQANDRSSRRKQPVIVSWQHT